MSCAPYTGPDGASCHQCKSRRRLTDLFFCCHMPSKTRTCRKKFCKLCLDKFYDNAEPKKGEELVWKCPSCLLKCTCASCQRIMDPSGAKKPKMIGNGGHDCDVDLSASNMLPSLVGRGSLDNTFEHDARQLLLSLTSLPGVRARINQFINLKGVDDQSKIEAIASLLNQGAFPTTLGDSESSAGSSTLMPQGSLWLRREKEMAFTFQ